RRPDREGHGGGHEEAVGEEPGRRIGPEQRAAPHRQGDAERGGLREGRAHEDLRAGDHKHADQREEEGREPAREVGGAEEGRGRRAAGPNPCARARSGGYPRSPPARARRTRARWWGGWG